jgi:hypothetical protein
MQNKPNSFEGRNNATSFTTRVYANKPPRPIRKNKPKQTQSRRAGTQYETRNTKPAPPQYAIRDTNPIKPNFKIGKMNISTAIIKAYANEQRTMSNERYSKQTQSNPILSRRSPERSRIPPAANPHFSPENESVTRALCPVLLRTPVSCLPFPPSGRCKPGNYCEALAVFFPVFALFFPRISSACSGVSGGHLPAD